MSNISDTATVTLLCNGAQAKKVIDDLKTNIDQAKKKVQELQDAKASPKDIEKAKKEVRKLERQLEEAQSATENVRNALENLNSLSLRDLDKTLHTLNKQFKNAKQGTEAYTELAAKIRAVKEQISAVRKELKESQSTWQRFQKWALDAWPALDLIKNWYDTAISTLRGFVDAYAEMDQEMASVRKFTGMTEGQVDELNEEFKKLDTRSSREQLNMLAQDAGRLGKQSVEDVMGFVRAADKVNVALDDLGAGATLTLSKLTGIFGVEERYGTEQSLLKVGSVINELSQNCSASAPYIANFTERMAGVGAQANMTIPQIMGFAAVLDSNSQAVEASATAVSQVLVRLYQDPAKYAKVAGLDVKEFSELLKKDANEALILFLDTLNKAGGMDVLSPMFKDMGENGSRAIAALSTLANKIDDVKSQQEVANEAFREGTSIDTEFDVQNNTVATGLDKCKNAAHEYQVELGQRLYPLMSHFLSSSAAVARGLLTVLRFLFDHKLAFVNLTVAIIAYIAAIKASAIETRILAAETAISKAVFASWTAVVKLGSAILALCTGNIQKARKAWLAFNTAIKASPIGLVVGLIALLISHIVQLTSKTDEYTKSADEAMKSATSFAEAMSKEKKEIDELFGKLDAAKKGTKEYNKAKEEIISRYGVYLQGLLNEKGEITNLALAYDRLTWAAQKSAQARGVAEAKKNLQSAFYSTVDDKTEDLRKRLLELGMDDRNVTRIITSISSSLAAGQDIPSEIRKEITAFKTENMSQFATVFGKKDPMEFVQDMRKALTDYKLRSAKLDSMDGRDFSKVSTEDLDKQIESIKKALASTSPVDKVDISISMDSTEAAQRFKSQYNERTQYFGENPKDSPLLAPKENTSLLTSGKQSVSTLDIYYSPVRSVDSLSVKKTKDGSASVSGYISRADAENLLRELTYEKDQRWTPGTQADNMPTGTGYESAVISDKERKKQEAEKRREEIEAHKEFKQALDDIKGNRAEAETKAMADRSAGLIDYRQYLERMREAELKYYEDASQLYVSHDLAEDEDHKTLLKKKQEADDKYNQQRLALNKETIERIAKIEEQEAAARYNSKEVKTLADELQYKEELLTIRYNKLMDLQSLYLRGSKEWEQYEQQLQDLLYKDHQEKQQAIIAKVAEFQKKFDKQSVADKYKLELEALELLYKEKKITEEQYQKWLRGLKEEEAKELPGAKPETAKSRVSNASKDYDRQKAELDKALAEGQISQEDYDARLTRIKNSLFDNIISPLKDANSEWVSLMANMIDSWKDFADTLQDPDGDPLGGLEKGIKATSALMSAVFSQMTAFMQAELQIQTAAVEKRYDKEIAAAEGNSYRVAKLEKQKESEIAKLKNDANRKMFAMQVIQAVAQTATNALNAYGSAAAIPVVGHIMAPIAAAMAVAAGMVQVAAIKKQQQASETQGYSKGGFTRPGAVDEPAGIVHAGEWVASQKLLASPVARPMIEALDYAQRTNTIGSLRSEDVSLSITAPQAISRIADGNPSAALMASAMASNAGVIDRLVRRLEEPFVTVNTVSGDAGIKRAQDEYTKLMNNKSPKSRRKNANNY